MRKGARWLKQAQRTDGSWGPCQADSTYDAPRSLASSDAYPVGPTAFAVFALAKCGFRKKDSTIHKALRWLNNNAPQTDDQASKRSTSYESAALVLMITALNDPRPDSRTPPRWQIPSNNPRRPPKNSGFSQAAWTWMHWLIQHLLACQTPRGSWGYYASDNAYQDVSATQFALLALRETVRAGYPLGQVASDIWSRAAKGLRAFQLPSGAFHYHAGEPSSAGRTVAGVSSLLICKEQLQRARRDLPRWLDPAIVQGLAFLDKTFDVERNAYDPLKWNYARGQYHYCHLYGIERVGALSGRREIGGKAWYPRGAAYLLKRQCDDSSWNDDTCMKPQDVLGTSFALLFLSRATPPVTIPTR